MNSACAGPAGARPRDGPSNGERSESIPPSPPYFKKSSYASTGFFFACCMPPGSPDRCAASPPGILLLHALIPGAVHSACPGYSTTRSPGKAFTPQPGEYAVRWYCCGFFPACVALSRATGSQIAGNPYQYRYIAPPPGLWQVLILLHPLILFTQEINQRPDRGQQPAARGKHRMDHLPARLPLIKDNHQLSGGQLIAHH